MYYHQFDPQPNQLENVLSFLKDIVAIVAPIVTGYFGIRFGIKQFKAQKRINLIEEQLNKFYSPLLGLIKEIRAKSILRVKVQVKSNEAWKEKADRATEKDQQYIGKEIQYDDNQFREQLLPLYNKMLDLFRENYWLAAPETQNYYTQLVEFIEIWNRYLADGIDPDAIPRLGHGEENLKPFYAEVESRTDVLRKELLMT